MIKIIILSVLLCGIISAQTNIKIYNQGRALVQEERQKKFTQTGKQNLLISRIPRAAEASSINIFCNDIEFISKYEKKNGELNDNYFRNVITKTNLARGFYAQFLRKWFDVYDRKQFLILSSSELANSTQKTLNKIFNFLEIPEYDIPDTTKINTQKYEPMKKQTREILIQFFKKYNNELYELIDRKFDWDK